MAGGRFQIVYQPIVDLRTGAAEGVEALARFTAAPLRPPEDWFAEAEQAGLRTSLELATAGCALRALSQLRPELHMTVNISPAAALSGRLGEILLGIDLDRVVLELTEHAPVADYPALTAALAPWRRAGARIAVDDAGGGYASFAHILSLSPEFIKLDLSLVRNIHIDRQRQALTRAITGFATELGVTVVAEGIETAAELEAVASLGTALAQGFHVGRPRPLDEQPELLADPAAPTVAAPEPTRQLAGRPAPAPAAPRGERPRTR
jgi:EAL domain-containing protein (putative c-di-GMP-specific phosphodiesterase class I)